MVVVGPGSANPDKLKQRKCQGRKGKESLAAETGRNYWRRKEQPGCPEAGRISAVGKRS